MSYLHVFLIIFFIVFKSSRIQLLPGCLLHMQQDLQCCVQSSCPALAPSSPNRLPAVGPLGSPVPWLLQFSYQCLWDQRKGLCVFLPPLPNAPGPSLLPTGTSKREEEEDWAFASSGDSRAVGKGREWDRVRGANSCCWCERLGQVSSWHRPLTRHCHIGHTHILYSSFTHILYSSLRPCILFPE